jgi:DNA-binding MarR family transcriptional regulator
LENIQRANRHEKTLRVSDLSSILRVSSPTITQHLNYLENNGLVDRKPLKEDKRAVTLTLTEKGNEALKSHWIKLQSDFSAFIETIGESDAENLIELIRKSHSFFLDKAKEYENENFFERG